MMKKIVCVLMSMIVVLSSTFTVSFASEARDIEWYNFKNNQTNNGVTDRPMPNTQATANLKWAQKYGTGYAAACTPPLILDGYLYVAMSKYVIKIDKSTGQEVARSDEMPAAVGYAMMPMTYADGRLFVPIGNGMIECVDYETLKCEWRTEKIGGQTLTPTAYTNVNGTGYLYYGTWQGENKSSSMICVSTDNKDVNSKGVKKAIWRFTPSGNISGRATSDIVYPDTAETNDETLINDESYEGKRDRGFYWAGAYACEKFVAFGSDDGSNEGNYDPYAIFYTVNPVTGAVIDRIKDIKGDIRDNPVYDDGNLYFSTKGGIIYKVPVDENGNLDEDNMKSFDLKGSTTATPIVYKGRIYMGVQGKSQFAPDSPHRFVVVDAKTMTEIYSVETVGYPQAGGILSNAYENEDFNKDGKPDGRVYIYFTYNYSPGGIYYFSDEPGQKKAKEQGNLYVPTADKQNYCISTICVDKQGTLYYKNDSCNLFAISNSDAYVQDIKIGATASDCRWDQDFNAGITDYNLVMKSDIKNAKVELTLPKGVSAKVNDTPYNSKAGATINLDEDGKATLIVEASTTKNTRKYILNIRTESKDANLEELCYGTSNSHTATALKPMLPEFTNDYRHYVYDASGDTKEYYNLWIKSADINAKVEVKPLSGIGDKTVLDENGNVKITQTASSKYPRYAIYYANANEDVKLNIKVTAEDTKTVKNYYVNLTKKFVKAESLSLSSEKIELNCGTKEKKIMASTYPQVVTADVEWISDNEKVAKVDDNGKVTAVGVGDANIKAIIKDGENEIQENCEVSVKAISHTFDDAKITKKATATQSGNKLYTCKICHSTKTEEFNVTPINKLSCSGVGYKKVKLSWSKITDKNVSYKIERSIDNKNWKKVVVLNYKYADYTDSTLKQNTKYYYRVQVTDKIKGVSKYVSKTAKTSKIPAIKNFKATKVTKNTIKLSWSKTGEKSVKYEIYRSTNNKKWKKIKILGANFTSYTDKHLKKNTKYYYRIRIVDDSSQLKQYSVYTVVKAKTMKK